jgi:hypothetical protein
MPRGTWSSRPLGAGILAGRPAEAARPSIPPAADSPLLHSASRDASNLSAPLLADSPLLHSASRDASNLSAPPPADSLSVRRNACALHLPPARPPVASSSLVRSTPVRRFVPSASLAGDHSTRTPRRSAHPPREHSPAASAPISRVATFDPRLVRHPCPRTDMSW